MTINEALRVVRRRWRIVVLCLLLGLLGAGVATYLTPRQYSSDVTMYVSLQGRAENSDAAYQASQLAKERVASYAPLLKDERVTQPVIDRLQLGVTPLQLADRITVTVQPDTVVLSASVTDGSPERAATIMNELAKEFVGLVGDLEEPIGPTPPAIPGQPAPQASKIGVEIVRPAAVNPIAISPNRAFNLALGAALGLLVGLAAAFVRDARDTTIRSADRLRALAGASVLAEIPGDRDARMHPVTLGAPPGSPRVEAFRKLRTNLQFQHGRPHRVVVVTSATVGEGKSTTACNLALALADSGSRVLLIDLNLRRPDVDGYLELEPGAGAANVLAGRITFSRAVLRWVEGRMDVLPAGPVPLNPSEMLASRATAMLLDEVRGKYDFVIIDTPALLPVTDAAAVAARADGAILVVRYGRTSEEQIADAVNALEAVGTSLLGVALTRTPAARRRRPQQVSAGSYPEPDPVPPSLPRPPARNVGPVATDQPPHLPPRPATGEQTPVAPRPPQSAEQSGPMRQSSPDGGPTRTPADGHAAATAAAEHLPNGSTEKPAPSPSPRP